jgi:hypothetical protein
VGEGFELSCESLVTNFESYKNIKPYLMKLKINFPKTVLIIFSITLITVLISNIIIGGDALSGKVENNKYFVWDAIRYIKQIIAEKSNF